MLQHLLLSRRKRLRLSRKQLAHRTGLSLSYLSMLENGQRATLTPHTRALLACALGVGYATIEAAEAIPPEETWELADHARL